MIIQFRAILLLLFWTTVSINAQKNPIFVNGRNTIVHLFEWPWNSIAEECENFLSKAGYAGVQLSPPGENVIITSPDRPWWERYQPVSYLLKTRSGDEAALADMIKRCNAVGVRVYIDAVINHMAALSGTGTAGSTSDPDNNEFPAVPFHNSDFHEHCSITNDQDVENLRNCELNGLRDLDQTVQNVRDKQIEYFNHLIDLGVAGFRVDAAKLMWPNDLEIIYGGVKDLNTDHGFPAGTKPFFYQEVIDFDQDPVDKTEYIGFGNVLEFRFGTFLGDLFQGNGKLADLVNWGPDWNLLDGKDAVVFIDNHDNQRHGTSSILTYKNSRPYKMAIAFMLAHTYDATTRIISSYYFEDPDMGPPNSNGEILGPGFYEDNTCTNGWVCEHRWREIYNMVGFRNSVAGTELNNWWTNGDNQIAFGRGDKGFIVFNVKGDLNESLQTGLAGGSYCDVISGEPVNGKCTGLTIEVSGDGKVQISLTDDSFDGVIAIHVGSKL